MDGTGIIEHLHEFATKWDLDGAAQEVLFNLSRESVDIALEGFAMESEGMPASEMFKMFASGLGMRANGPAAGVQHAGRVAALQQMRKRPEPAAQLRTFLPPAKMLKREMESMDAPSIDDIQGFIDKWGLNDDSINNIRRLSPEALKIVLREFAPKGEWTDCNGRFIVFASRVEQGLSKGGGQHGQFNVARQPRLTIPVQAAPQHTMVDDALLGEFAQKWGLNEDAQLMLTHLDPMAIQIVMTEFKAPAHATEVSGLLIKFAGAVQKRMGLPLPSLAKLKEGMWG